MTTTTTHYPDWIRPPQFTGGKFERAVKVTVLCIVGFFMAFLFFVWVFTGKHTADTESGTCVRDGHGGYSAVAFSDRVETGWEYTAQCG